jgi:TPR repeat protein
MSNNIDSNNKYIQNITYNLTYKGINQIISKNFIKMDTKEIGPTVQNINQNVYEGDLRNVVDELIKLTFEDLNKGNEENVRKQHILDYFNNHKIFLKEIYNWLLNNQNNSNSIYLLGYFNYSGIEININIQKAFELYQKASELKNIVAQLDFANMCIHEKGNEKNHIEAFKLSKRLADRDVPNAVNKLGYCYDYGIGTEINKVKAFELYQKAADLGNLRGINNLGRCYENGTGTDINVYKAFELYKKSADSGNSYGLNNLGCCYDSGIGIDINKQKAFELFHMAANLGNDIAQYNIAIMFEKGEGTEIDVNKAIYWYGKSAAQGDTDAQNKLCKLLEK